MALVLGLFVQSDRAHPPGRHAGVVEMAGRPEMPNQAAEWRKLAWRDEFGRYPLDGLARARAHVDRMRAAAAQISEDTLNLTRSSWHSRGPGNIGGRVRALAIHPTTPATMFAGGATGGLWKTTDSGASWTVVDDFLAHLTVSSILYAPGAPSTMFAGTGESFVDFQGDGILRSTNGGTSWSQLSSTSSTATSNFMFVNRLAASPDGLILLAATNTGLFRSLNNGDAWTQVLNVASLTPTASRVEVSDVKFLAGSSTQVVASGKNRNAYYSTNGGVSWTLASGPAVAPARAELAVAGGASPSTVYLVTDDLVVTDPFLGTLGGGNVWRSTNGGASFTLMSSPGHMARQGGYNNAIWVDPTNADTVVIGGIDLHRSVDAGATWTRISAWGSAPVSAHADQHIILPHPQYDGSSNKTVYIGNDGGVYRTTDVLAPVTDPGTQAASIAFTELNNTLGITQFYAAAGHAATGLIIGGTQDNGTIAYTSVGGAEGWTTRISGDGGYTAIDPGDPTVSYAEFTNLKIHRATNSGAAGGFIYGGSPFADGCTKSAPYRLEDACNGTANFIAPFMLDPNNANRLLAGGRSLSRTDDVKTANSSSTGPTWAAIKAPTSAPSANSNISAIAVAAGQSDVIWVGHNNGDVFTTSNGTAASPAWTKVDENGALPGRMATSIAIDPASAGVVYVSFGGFTTGNVWKTSNGGSSWTNISGTGAGALPAVPVRSVAVHPSSSSSVYAGTELGVFVSGDSGATWAVPNAGPANVGVYQLFWMNTDLVAVTYGRGIFSTATAGPATVIPAITAHPSNQAVAAGQSATFVVAASGTPDPTWRWEVSADGGSTFAPIAEASPYSGVTSATLTISGATVGLNGARYRAMATNSAGAVATLPATLTVYGAASASPSSLRFAATKAGATGALTSVTRAQAVTLTFAGAASGWTAASNQTWLTVAGGAGSGAGQFTATVGNPDNVIGSSTSLAATITVSAPTAPNTTLSIPVTLTVDQTGTSTVAPFGQVDTPAAGASGVVGAVGVTGWVVDDVGITGVKVYRSCMTFENQASCQLISGHNVVFIGDAAFVAGARPDVEAAYSTYPASNVAGWGYLLLTNMLPNVTSQLGFGGQGSLDLFAFATDIEGHVTLLGRTSSDHTPTSITMSNNTIAKPFGAIDTPSQGGTVSGTFANFGWVLTPDSNTTAESGDILMATNGSSMRVFIDGVSIGNVTYNQCRGNVGNPVPAGQYCNDDVANIFGNATPQPVFTTRTANATLFRNLDAGRAVIGSFDINTSGMTNGSHSIAWGVTDSAGRSEGIGSRNFFVLNTGGDPPSRLEGAASADKPATLLEIAASARQVASDHAQIRGEASSLPAAVATGARVTGRGGFSLETPFTEVVADASGERHVEIDQMGRVELRLGAGIARGYLVANGTLRDLPAGSHLDVATGTFTWAPAPVYLGAYRLVFLADGRQLPVTATIRPRPAGAGEPEIRMHVDSPAAGEIVGFGSARLRQGFGEAATTFVVAGWSLDPQAFTGSGIGAVHVWAQRLDVPAAAPQFVGAATLGVARPDVAAAFGASHDRAGFSLAASLAPGLYDITVYAWNVRTARWEDARTVRVTVR